MSRHDQHHFRMVGRNRVGDVLQQHGFAGAWRGDDKTALALADGDQHVHDAGAHVVAHGLQLEALLRIKRRQVVEENLVAGLVGRLEVDGLDLDQRKVFFSLVGRPHLAADGIAGLQVELADLRGRDIDVVGAGQVVVIRRAQEAVAVGKDFQHAFGEDVAFFFALRLQDFEDQILLAQAARTGEVELASDLGQLGNVLFFEFSDRHVHLRNVLSRGRNQVRREAPGMWLPLIRARLTSNHLAGKPA